MSEGEEDELDEMEDGEDELSETEEPAQKAVGELETSVEGNVQESPKTKITHEEIQEPPTKI